MVQASASGGGSVIYGYDSANHRIYKGAFNGSSYSAEEIYFYGVDGHKYGTWQINAASGVLLQASVTKQWFGKRLLAPEDHLHSQGNYYAFGEERTGITPANPPDDQEKFATYTRDSTTDLDCADQRYYSSIIGRFMRPDPYGGSSNPMVPQSWNRYSYVANDPANHDDPLGLVDPSRLYQAAVQGASAGISLSEAAAEEAFTSGFGTAFAIGSAYEAAVSGTQALLNLGAGLFTDPGTPANLAVGQAADAMNQLGSLPGLVGSMFSNAAANFGNLLSAGQSYMNSVQQLGTNPSLVGLGQTALAGANLYQATTTVTNSVDSDPLAVQALEPTVVNVSAEVDPIPTVATPSTATLDFGGPGASDGPFEYFADPSEDIL